MVSVKGKTDTVKIDEAIGSACRVSPSPSRNDGVGRTLPSPCFSKVGVLAFVPDRWGGVWQPRHQVMIRLAKYFHVVWVDPAVEWRDLWLRAPWARSHVIRDETMLPSFQVYRHGGWLPKVFKPASVGKMIERVRLAQARRLLKDQGCDKIILYLWRPDFASVLDEVEHDLSCYHIDDEYSFSTVEQPLDRQEAGLITRAGQVFIHSPALWEKKSHLNPHSLLVPNGVDFSRFATPRPEPEDLKPIVRPRMGYVGVIQSTINWSLLHELVKRHQEWSFVFVGPQGNLEPHDLAHVTEMAKLKNAHFLGGKPVGALGAYTQHMSVCMMPYKMNDYTKFIYPLKLHEYLASGRPTVGSPIRSLQDYGHVVSLAISIDDWSFALSEALGSDRNLPAVVESRRKVARTHDWDMLVERIAKTMCDRLGSPYRENAASLLPELAR